MTRMSRVAIAVSAVAVAVILAGCEDATQGDQKTLSFTEPPESEQQGAPIGQAPEQGPQAGSGFAFGTPLQDSSGKTVGELNATCIFTQTQGKSEKAQCNGTANVPGGQLALDVGGSLPRNITGAIVGGTGDYSGATGTFESKDLGHGKGSQDTFNVTLP